MIISEENQYPARCKLYNLKPIGKGTQNVESLASYISRLAYIHSVSFTIMLRRLLQGYILPTPININGDGLITEQLVKRIEEMNYRSDIRNLTLLSLENEVIYAINRTRAWCPMCYQEYLNSNQIVYDPLLWSINMIKACVKHKVYLETKCPNCLKEQIYRQYYRPGFCVYCGSWLGSNVAKEAQQYHHLNFFGQMILYKLDGYSSEFLIEMSKNAITNM